MDTAIKILHLEDLPSDAALIKNALDKSKIIYQGLIVDTKDRFIAALTEFVPDIILSDHSLPSFNSIEAMEIVKQAQSDIPFIVITSAMSDESAVELMMKGADDYILKDRLSRLPVAIHNALEKFRLKKERQKYLNEIIESEKRYRALIEHSADGVVILDRNGAPTYVSASVKNVLGYETSEVLNMDLFTLMHPDDKTDITLMLEKILNNPGKTIQGHTGRMLHKDGSWRWIEATVTNLLTDPAINGIVDNFRDITEKKHAQDAILKNEHKFRSLVENSMDAMAILTQTGKPSYVSPSIINVLGYTDQEGMELDLFALAHHQDIPELIQVMEQALTNPGVAIRGSATRMKHKNGEWCWIEGIITNMLHDPAINGFVDNFRNVTQKKHSEQVLTDSEEKYRLLFETSMDGILLTSKSGQVLEANQAACEIFQMRPDELCSLNRPDLTDITDPTLISLLEERSRTGKANGEIFFRRKDGSRFAAEISSNVFRDTYGSEKTSMVIRDISKRKLAEQLLRESEQFNKGILSSLSSHIAVIDSAGTIIAVNKAWEDFAKTNGVVALERASPGSNYFDVCEKAILAGQVVAQHALKGILLVINENLPVFELEYPLQLANTLECYILQVRPLGKDDSRVVLSHQNVTELKNAGQQLQLSESRLKQAQAMAKIGSWETDLQTSELIWSEQTYCIFEMNADTFTPTYQAFLSLIHPYDRMMVDHALQNSHENASLNRIEHRIIMADGRQKTLEERWSVFNDKQGMPVRAVGTCQDITERVALEQLLDKATTLARIGSYEADLVNNRMFWSPMTKQIHELDQEYTPEIKTALDFYKEGTSREAIYTAVGQAIKKHTPFDLELQIITAKGNERWVRVIGETELAGDRCIRIYGSFQDINKIKKAESEVLRVFEEKNIILESIGDAFFAVDKDWVINYWNKEAARLLLQPKSEVLNKNLWAVFAGSINSESYKKYHQAVLTGQIVHFEDYYEPLKRWLEVSAYPSANGLSVFFKDITDRKSSETKLIELNENLRNHTSELVASNKGLEQFSYIVSHNLRAPVANIIGLADLLSQDSYPAEIKEELLSGVLVNVKRLDDVIIDLNTILQVKREVSEKKEAIDLQQLVNNIQLSIQEIIVKEQVQIQTDFSAIQQLTTLKSYLHSILYNLIMNSIKYHQPNVPAVISIKSSLNQGIATISVIDNGLGIDLARKAEQVFGLYKRFHQHVEGKGMGLFMVKTQVEMLGGKIAVNSRINKGTEFIIEFNSDHY